MEVRVEGGRERGEQGKGKGGGKGPSPPEKKPWRRIASK